MVRNIKKLSIIIPVYNEEKTVSLVLDKVSKVDLIGGIEKEIIIVNDCSTDATEDEIYAFCKLNPGIQLQYFSQSKNRGKGAALHKGISHATGDYFIVQDADLEYDPNEYNNLLSPVLNNCADVVYGSRFKKEGQGVMALPFQAVVNKTLTWLINMVSNLKLTDMETCYKLFDTKLVQTLRLREQGFGFEPEVTAKISRVPELRISEVEISYLARTYSEGKKIGPKDGLRAVYCILKYGLFGL